MTSTRPGAGRRGQGGRPPTPSFPARGSNTEHMSVALSHGDYGQSSLQPRDAITASAHPSVSWSPSAPGREARRGWERPTLPSWTNRVGLAWGGGGARGWGALCCSDRTPVSWSLSRTSRRAAPSRPCQPSVFLCAGTPMLPHGGGGVQSHPKATGVAVRTEGLSALCVLKTKDAVSVPRDTKDG